ncbi:MAG: large conductance mechanosensitive channel protein MscL [Bacteroides sp.]|jgi:large conductance mechanosensitive channel|nr:large conductance mechanosensitive channel protein MscL [Bacteroides sp.]
MASFTKEFKEFAVKGNVIDMAVGIIIGGAFGKIISSLVSDIIMPPIGKLLGGVDFANLFYTLGDVSYATLAEATEAGAATINYGVFINTVIDFLLIALSIFFVIRWINKLKKKEAPAPAPEPTTKECPYCLTQIPIKATRCPNCTSQL